MTEPKTITSAEMRALEQAAIESGKVTGLELMERAGQSVVDAIFEEWPELSEGPHRAMVLCGPGNNGGDGFFVAKLLQRLGWLVVVFTHGDIEKLPPDAMAQYDAWGGTDAEEDLTKWGEYDGLETISHNSKFNDLLIDALFGIGLSRKIKYPLEVAQANLSEEIKVVAIDVPSGLQADTGKVVGDANFKGFHRCLHADLTVTFHAPKAAHVSDSSRPLCGKTVVKDIGL